MNVNPRVAEFEESEWNPPKLYMPDFGFVPDDGLIHRIEANGVIQDFKDSQTSDEVKKLVAGIAKIRGVAYQKITIRKLSVYKFPTHTWDELSEQIREFFRSVYPDIEIRKENPVRVILRRARVAIKN